MNLELNDKLFKVLGFYPPQCDIFSSYFRGMGASFTLKYVGDQILGVLDLGSQPSVKICWGAFLSF